MLTAPAYQVAQCRDRVDELERPQSAYDFPGIEQVASQHRDHTLLDLPDIARLPKDPVHDRTVEPIDEKCKPLHAGALTPLQLAQQACLAVRLTQRRVDHGGGLLGTAHGEINTRRKHRIQKREGIADHHPTRGAHLRRIVRVIAGYAHFLTDQLGMLDSPSEVVVLLQSLQEEVDGLSLPLLQIGRAAHGSDAHDTIRQWNHPHPTVLEAIDADIAGIFAGTALGTAKVAKNCSALVLAVFTTQA